MLSKDFLSKYGLTISVVLIASYFGTQIKKRYNLEETEEKDYDMIKKYILNDSPLYGFNKPKLWIHSKYEKNARKWRSFHSRTSDDLNQEYINYTVESLINKCGKDFHICLIDDKSFNKLIPGFNKDINSLPEPVKSQEREIAMLLLLHLYGGMIVPNTFICMDNLINQYKYLTAFNKPFVFEKINKYCDMKNGKKIKYVPNIDMIGSNKGCPIIYSLIRDLNSDLEDGHIDSENEFTGETSNKLMNYIKNSDMISVCGSLIGIKDSKGEEVKLEDLFSSNKEILFSKDKLGILLPREEILERSKYNWFAHLSEQDLLHANVNIVKYIKLSLISEYVNNTKNVLSSI